MSTWSLAELDGLERSGRPIGPQQHSSKIDLLCDKAVLDAFDERPPVGAFPALVQQGRDTPLEEVFADALEETART